MGGFKFSQDTNLMTGVRRISTRPRSGRCSRGGRGARRGRLLGGHDLGVYDGGLLFLVLLLGQDFLLPHADGLFDDLNADVGRCGQFLDGVSHQIDAVHHGGALADDVVPGGDRNDGVLDRGLVGQFVVDLDDRSGGYPRDGLWHRLERWDLLDLDRGVFVDDVVVGRGTGYSGRSVEGGGLVHELVLEGKIGRLRSFEGEGLRHQGRNVAHRFRFGFGKGSKGGYPKGKGGCFGHETVGR